MDRADHCDLFLPGILPFCTGDGGNAWGDSALLFTFSFLCAGLYSVFPRVYSCFCMGLRRGGEYVREDRSGADSGR